MALLRRAFLAPLCLAPLCLAAAGAGGHVIETPSAPATLGTPGTNALEGARPGGGVKLVPSGEFPLDEAGAASLPGHRMRVRFFEIAPGGVVPKHSHDGRPAIAVVVEGEMTEHRSDRAAPEVLGPGGVSLEPHGLEHWWENTGEGPAKIIGYDVYKAE
ncbi:MAG: cupin domain-containing protein [Pseudomonadota bacterium]